MRNWVILVRVEDNVWRQFTAMTAWTRDGAIAKATVGEYGDYQAVPARWWKTVTKQLP